MVGVVGPLIRALMSDTPLVDELVVTDSDSTDGTAEEAVAAGAVVHRARLPGRPGRSFRRRGAVLRRPLRRPVPGRLP